MRLHLVLNLNVTFPFLVFCLLDCAVLTDSVLLFVIFFGFTAALGIKKWKNKSQTRIETTDRNYHRQTIRNMVKQRIPQNRNRVSCCNVNVTVSRENTSRKK